MRRKLTLRSPTQAPLAPGAPARGSCDCAWPGSRRSSGRRSAAPGWLRPQPTGAERRGRRSVSHPVGDEDAEAVGARGEDAPESLEGGRPLDGAHTGPSSSAGPCPANRSARTGIRADRCSGRTAASRPSGRRPPRIRSGRPSPRCRHQTVRPLPGREDVVAALREAPATPRGPARGRRAPRRPAARAPDPCCSEMLRRAPRSPPMLPCHAPGGRSRRRRTAVSCTTRSSSPTPSHGGATTSS